MREKKSDQKPYVSFEHDENGNKSLLQQVSSALNPQSSNEQATIGVGREPLNDARFTEIVRTRIGSPCIVSITREQREQNKRAVSFEN